jgi:hypothetical protein
MHRLCAALAITSLIAWPGQRRHFTLNLVQVCYPELWAGTRLHTSWLDSSGSPVRLVPRVTIKGCGHP